MRVFPLHRPSTLQQTSLSLHTSPVHSKGGGGPVGGFGTCRVGAEAPTTTVTPDGGGPRRDGGGEPETNRFGGFGGGGTVLSDLYSGERGTGGPRRGGRTPTPLVSVCISTPRLLARVFSARGFMKKEGLPPVLLMRGTSLLLPSFTLSRSRGREGRACEERRGANDIRRVARRTRTAATLTFFFS
jgi:hypothetical protein